MAPHSLKIIQVHVHETSKQGASLLRTLMMPVTPLGLHRIITLPHAQQQQTLYHYDIMRVGTKWKIYMETCMFCASTFHVTIYIKAQKHVCLHVCLAGLLLLPLHQNVKRVVR